MVVGILRAKLLFGRVGSDWRYLARYLLLAYYIGADEVGLL